MKRNALFAARADHVREKEKKASQLAVDSESKTTDQKTKSRSDQETAGGRRLDAGDQRERKRWPDSVDKRCGLGICVSLK